MSNALAIATVTTALAQLVRTAAQSVVNGAEVVTGRPDPNATPAHRVHLFLYQVSPNGAMRNNDLPTRSSDGKLVARPTAALDLHYLLAFYGSETELETQRMLGAVVRDLHATPVLTRQMIRNAVASQNFLQGSNLADAVEQVKFTPLAVSLEELSKLWSVFFQTPYALSVAYQGTVVLIESEEPTQPALPVLSRGDKDQGVDTLLGPFPVIESAYFGLPQDPILQSRPLSLPAAQLGLAMIVSGRNFGGDTVLLRFRHSGRELRNSQNHELISEVPVTPVDRSATELKVVLPQPGAGTTPSDWAPGVYTVTVVDTRSGSPRESSSNALPMALSPIIAAIEPGTTIPRDAQGTATLTITCQPRVHSGQQAVLLVAGMEIVGQVDGGNPDKVIFVVENAPVVTNELIRLRVDGIESMPFKRVDTPPPTRFEFDPNQRVTIT
jgi:hypothetical protein